MFLFPARCVLLLDRMHERRVKRRRGPDVRARQVDWGHAHHHLAPVRLPFRTVILRAQTHIPPPPLLSVSPTLAGLRRSPALMRYHTQLLTIAGDGTGRWTLKRIGTAEERMDMDREIVTLEQRLAEVEKWEARVKELERLLSVQEI